MPRAGETFSALLATGRVANIPTVCSNVLAGYWLAGLITAKHYPESQGFTAQSPLLIWLMLMTSAIYVGGCMLGDAMDAEFDRQHRPQRPIPSGILSAHSVQRGAVILLATAVIGLTISSHLCTGLQADIAVILSLLTLVVITYAVRHKKNKVVALLLMASCRFFLVLMAIAAGWGILDDSRVDSFSNIAYLTNGMVILPLGVGCYTLLLSWVASTESRPGVFKSRNILACGLLLLPAMTVLLLILAFGSMPVDISAMVLALVILYLWLGSALIIIRKSKPAFVSRALAGFCLLDACFLAPFAPGMATVCLCLFVLALLMQRLTPAT